MTWLGPLFVYAPFSLSPFASHPRINLVGAGPRPRRKADGWESASRGCPDRGYDSPVSNQGAWTHRL